MLVFIALPFVFGIGNALDLSSLNPLDNNPVLTTLKGAAKVPILLPQFVAAGLEAVANSHIVDDPVAAQRIRCYKHQDNKTMDERVEDVKLFLLPIFTKQYEGNQEKIDQEMKKAETKFRRLVANHDFLVHRLDEPDVDPVARKAGKAFINLIVQYDENRSLETVIIELVKTAKGLDLDTASKLLNEYKENVNRNKERDF